MLNWSYFFIIFFIINSVWSSPKKFQSEDGGFSPNNNNNRYYEADLYEKNYKNKTYIPRNPIAEGKKDYDGKESRFGSISYGPGSSGNGYGNNGVSYGTMKLDIGGVALGALIGLGAILILPKIAQIFAGAHEGGYARGIDEEMSAIKGFLNKIDNSFAENNIDSVSCSQRIICNMVNDAVRNEKSGEISGVDQFVLSFTNNNFFSQIIDGTAIKEAVEIGKNKDDLDQCTQKYVKCPLNRENILKVISNFIPTN